MIGRLQRRLPIVTTDPVELSTRVIDTGEHDEAVNRVTDTLSELADGISVVESFSHVVSFATDGGLVCFDTSGHPKGPAVVDALRSTRSCTPTVTSTTSAAVGPSRPMPRPPAMVHRE